MSGEARTRTTLADIASICGVAPSTVSRALADPDRVNRVTRERILAVAAEFDYLSPSQARRAERARRPVAVLVPDVTNPYFAGLIRGSQHELREAGRTQLLVDTEESEAREAEVLSEHGPLFEGAVLAASRLTDRRLTELARVLPIVAVNRQTRAVPHIFIDTPGGTVGAYRHLRSLGHRRIAYASGPRGSWPNERRWRALSAAATASGGELLRLGPFTPDTASGDDAVEAVLESGATACIAFNDLLAMGMLLRLRDLGVRVPEDLSVVGCDDIFGAAMSDPPLTTVTTPVEQAGRTAIAMLLGRAGSGGRASAVTLPTRLTVRGSTGPAPRKGTP